MSDTPEQSTDPKPGSSDRARTLTGSSFPVDTLQEAVPELRRPFTPNAVRFKLQTRTLAVVFIDSRVVSERLNLVCPHLWSDKYVPQGIKNHISCELTIGSLTRSDVGEASTEAPVKGMYSDALKRAAVQWGIGVSLYSWPKTFVRDNHVITREGKPQGLSQDGERHLRELYARWLKEHGEPVYGTALDHGDPEGIVGDYEVDPNPPLEGPMDETGRQQLIARVHQYTETQRDLAQLAAKITELGARPDGTAARELEAAAGTLERFHARELWLWIDEQLGETSRPPTRLIEVPPERGSTSYPG